LLPTEGGVAIKSLLRAVQLARALGGAKVQGYTTGKQSEALGGGGGGGGVIDPSGDAWRTSLLRVGLLDAK
jgi:hypothetical protein